MLVDEVVDRLDLREELAVVEVARATASGFVTYLSSERELERALDERRGRAAQRAVDARSAAGRWSGWPRADRRHQPAPA